MKLASGILPIAQDTRQICIAWRSPEVREGNRFGTIGGMCKTGKSPKESALIELDEEMGYTGPIELHKAFVCRLKGFEYHNFIGTVPTAFTLDPEKKYEWETSFIEWMEYDRIQNLMAGHAKLFHKGLIQLFRESKSLIEAFLEPRQ
jgi:8-oxo-dGTP pyrophosphatase MutT (NUDIX family)